MTDQMTKTNTGEDLAAKILAGDKIPHNVPVHCGRDIIRILKENGAKTTEMYSTCKHATYEERVELKDGRVVTVVEAWFMGNFTDITVWSAK